MGSAGNWICKGVKVRNELGLLRINDTWFFALAGRSGWFDFFACLGWVKRGTLIKVYKQVCCLLAVKARGVGWITSRSPRRLRVGSRFASLWRCWSRAGCGLGVTLGLTKVISSNGAESERIIACETLKSLGQYLGGVWNLLVKGGDNGRCG